MVRCPGCGTAQSPWAARCEQCGAGLAGAVEVDEDHQPGRRVGTRQPSRRRVALGLVAGAGVIALSTALVVSLMGDHAAAGHRVPPSSARPGLPPPPSRPVPLTVVEVDESGRLLARDLQTGAVQVLAPDAAAWPEGPATVDNQVLYISAGAVREPGRPLPLVAGDSLVPVNGMEEVWATSLFDGGPAASRLLEAPTGWGDVEGINLGPGETPTAAGLGHLVTVSGTQLIVRDANTGRVLIRTGPVNGPEDVIGVDSATVLFVRGGCASGCPLELLDTSTGRTRTLPTPPTTTGFIGGGAISPDGDIAAFAATPGGPAGPFAELVLIDTSGAERVVPVPLIIGEPAGAAAWDPTGRWLVFGGPRATYLLDRTTMGVTRLSFVAGYGFTVASG